jgi:hypothetical protein
LWSGHLAEVPAIDPADEPDLDWLAERVDVTGGTIRNVVLAAAFGASGHGEAVGMRHLSAAVRREYSKLGRRLEESAWIRPPAFPAPDGPGEATASAAAGTSAIPARAPGLPNRSRIAARPAHRQDGQP